MTTFDLDEVRRFTADLDTQMNRCDNGEGTECATLDATLKRYAELCSDLCDEVREWGNAVFAGRVAYDPEVERAWHAEVTRLYNRAFQMWDHRQKSEGLHYNLEGFILLKAALFDLGRLLSPWITPQLAVGPSARQESVLKSLDTDEVRQRVASLPPLPAKWEPADPSQRARYQIARNS